MRTVEVEPSLYAADFSRLGEQIEILLDAGARVFHFDVGDGHFVQPVTIGPVVLRSIAPLIHAQAAHRLPPDGRRPRAPLRGDRGVGRRQRHLPLRGRGRRRRRDRAGPRARPRGRARLQPRERRSTARPRRRIGADLCLCMSILPGYSGQEFMADAFGRIERLRALVDCFVQVDGGVKEENVSRCTTRAPTCSSSAAASSRSEDLAQAYRGSVRSPGMSLAARARARRRARAGLSRTRPSAPSSSRDGEIVGEGATEAGRAARRGRRARGRRRAGPRRDPLRDDGAVRAPRHDAAVRRRGARGRDRAGRRRLARPEPGGGGRPRAAARQQGVEVELADRVEARRQNEAWRTWVAERRPFVTYKARGDARRARHRAGLALGLRRGGRAGSCTSCAPPRTPSPSGWAPCGSRTRASTRATSARRGSPGGSRSAAARCRRAPSSSSARPARGGAARARRRGRPVAPARRRPDARGAFLARPRRQAAGLRGADRSSGAGPGSPTASTSRPARPLDEPPGRRGRPPRGLRARALTSTPCSPGSCARSGTWCRSRTAGSSVECATARRARRLGRDRRRLPDGRRRADGRLAFDVVPETLAACEGLRRARQPRAGAPRGRAARRPLRSGPRRRRRPRRLGRAGRATGRRSGSSARPSCCATASRRARSRSTASR